MIILGLGSNIGDRLANLRKALKAIKSIQGLSLKQVSPIYVSDALVPANAPPDWDMPYLNLAIRCETTIEPLDLLDQIKNIEWTIGRKPEARHWGPRILDIDILAWDDIIINTDKLTVPHLSLQERPFALWPLADVAPFWKFPLPGNNHDKTAAEMVEQWGSRFSGDAPFHTRQIQQRIDTPQLVGIINVTPDSFSDGGRYLSPENALRQIKHLVTAGADIIDIGAESTAPNAVAVDADAEWFRLAPILSAIAEHAHQFTVLPKISVDTRHVEVAKKAMDMKVDWINDVTGLQDPAMLELISQSHADCVVMHHLSIPPSKLHVLPRNQAPDKLLLEWGLDKLEKLQKAGIHHDRIIFDPGIGFGKTPEQSLALIKQAAIFKKLNIRVLVGHSRKSFFSLFTDQTFSERDIETLAVSLELSKHDIDYLRVHNVDITARALKIIASLR